MSFGIERTLAAAGQAQAKGLGGGDDLEAALRARLAYAEGLEKARALPGDAKAAMAQDFKATLEKSAQTNAPSDPNKLDALLAQEVDAEEETAPSSAAEETTSDDEARLKDFSERMMLEVKQLMGKEER